MDKFIFDVVKGKIIKLNFSSSLAFKQIKEHIPLSRRLQKNLKNCCLPILGQQSQFSEAMNQVNKEHFIVQSIILDSLNNLAQLAVCPNYFHPKSLHPVIWRHLVATCSLYVHTKKDIPKIKKYLCSTMIINVVLIFCLQDIREAFTRCDRNKDGFIDLIELKEVTSKNIY